MRSFKKRDLVIGALVATATVCGALLASVVDGEMSFGPIIAAALAAGLCVTFGRRWYREILRTIEQQNERLKALTVLSKAIDGPAVYWSPHALAPETLALILHIIQCLGVRRVLELGTGNSTLFVAKLFKEQGVGQIDSFDHELRWAETSALNLLRRGLSEVAKVAVAPLTNIVVSGKEFQWYNLPEFGPGIFYDFIIVDGPPSWQGDGTARLPALYCLRSVMTKNCVLVLDDASRSWETQVAHQWERDFPEFKFQRIAVGRGLLVVSQSDEVFDLLPH